MSSSQKEGLRRSKRMKNKAMNTPPPSPSPQKLFIEIRHRITADRESVDQCFTYENVDPEAGSLIARSLSEDADLESLRPKY